MAYLGNTPTTQSFISGTDYFNGNASTVAFTLSRTVASVNDIEVVINNVVQQPNTAYTISGTTITFTSAPSAGTSNIYVRYLSTTTQAITPSQGTVSYQTMDSNMQAKQGISFKNKIINGAMVIDQRNAGAAVSSISSSGTYTVDRWAAFATQASKYTVQQNAGSVTPPSGYTNYLGITSSSAYSVISSDYFFVNQVIEGFNMADLAWGTANAKTITLSFWVYSSLTGSFGGALSNGTYSYPFLYTIGAANTWTQISVTVVGPTVGTWATNNTLGMRVQFGLGAGSTFAGTAGAWSAGNYVTATGAVSVVGTSGATWYITGVQLEVGTQATTFDYRSYGTELALCQRYYTKSYDISAVVPTVNTITGSVAYYLSGGSALWHCPFRTEMRTTPTVTTYSYQGTSGKVAGGSFAELVATVYQQSTGGFNIFASGNGGSDFYCNYQASAEL